MIGIITAMQKEFDLIADAVTDGTHESDYIIGRIGNQSVMVVHSGIGKVNAACRLVEMLNIEPSITKVISIGCAGAAKENLKAGDIVIGNSYSYYDVYCGEGFPIGQVQGYPAVFKSAHTDIANILQDAELGMIVSGDWFVDTQKKAQDILESMPSLYNIVAIDMESAALAHVCSKRKIDFVSARVISDNPLAPNQNEQYENFWNILSKKAFLAIIKYLKSL